MFCHSFVVDLCVSPHFRVKMSLFDEDSSCSATFCLRRVDFQLLFCVFHHMFM